jgi:hypothetical protein
MTTKPSIALADLLDKRADGNVLPIRCSAPRRAPSDVTGQIQAKLSENFNLEPKEKAHAKEVIHARASDRQTAPYRSGAG